MDPTAISTLIGSVGFPIACSVMCFYLIEKQRETNDKQREADRSEHKAETTRWVEALNNNTMVIQRLLDKLGGDNL